MAARQPAGQDRARRALRQPRHHRVQPGPGRQAREGREGQPGRAGDRQRAHLDDQLRKGAAALSGRNRRLLGAQPSRSRRDPGQVTRARASFGLVALALGGCATRGELIEQERRVAAQLSEQRRAIQSIQRELEQLRGDVEGTGPRASAEHEQVAVLEERLSRLEGKNHPSPEGELPTDGTTPPPAGAASATAAATPPPPPVPPPPSEDVWARDVTRDQQAIAASTAPERADLEAA